MDFAPEKYALHFTGQVFHWARISRGKHSAKSIAQGAPVKPAKSFPSGKLNPDGILTATSFHPE